MKKSNLLKIGFILNLGFIGIQIIIFILLIINFDLVDKILFDKNYNIIYQLLISPFSIGTVLFWGYNVYFFYKFDRYSGKGLLLFFLGVLYSPRYYYKVHILKRPLINKIKYEPVINNSIILEEYEYEEDYKKDL